MLALVAGVYTRLEKLPKKCMETVLQQFIESMKIYFFYFRDLGAPQTVVPCSFFLLLQG